MIRTEGIMSCSKTSKGSGTPLLFSLIALGFTLIVRLPLTIFFVALRLFAALIRPALLVFGIVKVVELAQQNQLCSSKATE